MKVFSLLSETFVLFLKKTFLESLNCEIFLETVYYIYIYLVSIEDLKRSRYLKHVIPRSMASSISSKNIQTENPIQTPNDPPRADMKVTKEYLAVSVMVFTLRDMKYTSSLR